ncbi:MAG: TrmH family RNA methyltransferase [Croceimicrobium sp.]
MPSLSAQKLIRKLRQRKYRWQEKLFVAEGPKLVQDLMDSGLKPLHLWSTNNFPKSEIIDLDLLSKLSHLSSPNEVIAVFPFPTLATAKSQKLLILDEVNDPGNLGTLLRTADWFGYQKVICTKGTADVYNSKTVQSTMGSLARLDIEYLSFEEIKEQYESHRFLIADMQGEDYQNLKAGDFTNFALVMGSESHGPREYWKELGLYITIPKPSESTIDSLNVAVAGALIMQHFS